MSIYKQYARPVWPPKQRSEALSACLQDTVKKIHAGQLQNLTKNQTSAKPELFSQSSPARSFQRGLARAQRSVARA